jgi:hypothetical protein
VKLREELGQLSWSTREVAHREALRQAARARRGITLSGLGRARCRDSRVHVVTDREPAYFQAAKMTRLARAAARAGADWVVPFDADELWFADRGVAERPEHRALHGAQPAPCRTYRRRARALRAGEGVGPGARGPFSCHDERATGPAASPVRHGSLRSQLEGQPKRLKIDDRVHLMGRTDNTEAVMRTAALHLMRSVFDRFPMPVLEACAIGAQTIAFDCSSGIRELRSDKSGGRVAGDLSGSTVELERLIADGEPRGRLGSAALEVAAIDRGDVVVDRRLGLTHGCDRRRHGQLIRQVDVRGRS